MPDIAMCYDYEPMLTGPSKAVRVCPKAADCHRHTARPSQYRQSWFGSLPLTSLDPFQCDYHWPTEGNPIPVTKVVRR